ncbi:MULTISPECIES: hypothetical protein [unclassified Bosea (in: a-proteobacteria)]|uniref:hypothetical protein n=1 Tax=unclassified Bosea (in: a-proteobacteria) TaxID=2653178 RepID=UPI000F751313|nr:MULTISPECIES: hypothetical protein [unclassified Bosea (in: a-proteobacteria)]AZO77521.1 hypothetical protein BLM15_07750 [Bosea sp. Tri-49]RXT18129.1 hypothetical protein B5U98_22915 [Bosea sp. Tri-39]RXT32726.1 hypothetical protein B5U99_29260 [Bosea sp. Tri-54]
MNAALPFKWNGEAMHPLPGFAKRCDAAFVIGEVYNLEAIEQRSAKSHAHYFASVNAAWQTLPENLAEQFPTSEHLRKWCLIRAGYAEQRQIVVSSKAEALRLAAFIKPMDGYAVVSVRECVVIVWTAESQSLKAMGKQRFQDSKTAVLELLSVILECEVTELGRAA